MRTLSPFGGGRGRKAIKQRIKIGDEITSKYNKELQPYAHNLKEDDLENEE